MEAKQSQGSQYKNSIPLSFKEKKNGVKKDRFPFNIPESGISFPAQPSWPLLYPISNNKLYTV